MSAGSFSRILEVLSRHEVEFVVVGGVAAVLHGAPVTTFDLDALVRVEQRNAERLLAALTELDARFREHHSLRPTTADVLAGGHLLLMTDAGPLDVLGFIGNKSRYEDVRGEAVRLSLGEREVPVLGLDELIRQKKAMGRPKDEPALRLLEEVARRRRRSP
jgi:hypothetical protein